MSEITNIITIEVTSISKGNKEVTAKDICQSIKNLPIVDDVVVLKEKKFVNDQNRKSVKVKKEIQKEKKS